MKTWGNTGRPAFSASDFRILLIAAVAIMFAFIGEARAGHPPGESVRILVVHSYSHDYPWTAKQHEGFSEQLRHDADGTIEIKAEFLDTKRRSMDAGYAHDFIAYLGTKYAGYFFDAIYVTDDNALMFAQDYMRVEFPGVPIFFSGVNDYSQLDKMNPNIVTGVFENKEIGPNIELLKSLLGDVSGIIVLGDGSSTYKAIEVEMMKVLGKTDAPKITYIADDNLQSLTQALDRAPKQPIILTTLGAIRNTTGSVLTLDEIIGGIAESKHDVIVSMEDVYILGRVLGGYVTSGEAQGRAAAKLVLGYIRGEPIRALLPVVESPNVYQFNDVALKRLNLEIPQDLPAAVEIVNRLPSFMEKYEKPITVGLVLLTAAFLVTLFSSVWVLIAKNRQLTAQRQRLRESETALQSNAKLLEEVGRLTKAGGWERDLRSGDIFWNAETCRIYGVAPAFKPSREKFLSFIDEEDRDRVRKIIEDAERYGTPLDLEAKMHAMDGAQKHIKMIGETVFEDGEPVLLRGTVQDITERVLAAETVQAALADAERANQAKSEFLASMSHELRTPLNAVLGFAQLMQFDPRNPLTRNQQEHIQSILDGGSHLLRLVNDVLDLARIEANQVELKIENVNANNIVENCVAMADSIGKPKQIEVHDEFSDGLVRWVRTDSLRFKQVLLNLLSNAIKYNNEGGQVTVRGFATEDGYLHIAVEDSGIGIPEQDHPTLFQMFHRLGGNPDIAREGAGVGLHVTKLLIDRLGGRVGFDSEEGVGSTFWFELPLTDPPEITET